MKKLTALFSTLLVCGWLVGCAPKADTPAPTTPAATEEHAEHAEGEHAAPAEGETSAPAEGETSAPAEGETSAPVEAAPEAGSTEN